MAGLKNGMSHICKVRPCRLGYCSFLVSCYSYSLWKFNNCLLILDVLNMCRLFWCFFSFFLISVEESFRFLLKGFKFIFTPCSSSLTFTPRVPEIDHVNRTGQNLKKKYIKDNSIQSIDKSLVIVPNI